MWNISSVLTYPLSVSWVNCPVCSLAQLWAGCLFPYSSVFTRFVLWVCLCVLDYQSFIPWVFCDLSLLVFLVRSCFKTVKKILNYLGVSSSGKPSLEMRPSLHSPKKPEHIWLQVLAAYTSAYSAHPEQCLLLPPFTVADSSGSDSLGDCGWQWPVPTWGRQWLFPVFAVALLAGQKYLWSIS